MTKLEKDGVRQKEMRNKEKSNKWIDYGKPELGLEFAITSQSLGILDLKLTSY